MYLSTSFLLRLSRRALYYHKARSQLAALCSGHSLKDDNLASSGVVSSSSTTPEEPYIYPNSEDHLKIGNNKYVS